MMERLQGVMERLILLGLAAVPTALAKKIVSGSGVSTTTADGNLLLGCQQGPPSCRSPGRPGAELCLQKVFQALSTPLASRKMKHHYLRKEFVLEAMLQTSHLLIPRCSKAYGAELCSLASLPFGGKASLIMVLNNMALSLWAWIFMLQVISKLLTNALLQDSCKQSGDLLFPASARKG